MTGALGIPQEIAVQPLDTQERAVGSRLDVARLQDPKFVDRLAQRYLIARAADAAEAPPGLDALAVQARGLVI